MDKLLVVFLAAFILNIIWEKIHSYLYLNYQGGRITNLILLRASFWDAMYISVFWVIFSIQPVLSKNIWFVIPLGFLLSSVIEIWALKSGRWAYRSVMPRIPVLNVGVTPVLQIGLIAYGIFYFVGL